MRTWLLTCLVAGCMFAGCVTDDAPAPGGTGGDGLGVLGGGGGGGGKVVNLAPVVQSLTATPASGANDGAYTITLVGVVFDANSEKTVDRLTVDSAGAAVVTSSHTVSNREADATTEPASFGADNWKVWSGAQKNDGVLLFEFRYTVPRFAPSGIYNWTATAVDKSGGSGTSVAVSTAVTRFALVEVAALPVLADGTNAATASWGGWSAQPGASNVEALNYIKLTNAGDRTGQRVVVDFSGAAFTGATDSEYTVPIDGNVEFAYFEDATPGVTAPDEGSFPYMPASAQGTVTIPFTAKDNIVYVKYRLVSLPDVLLDQSYTASYTVTEI